VHSEGPPLLPPSPDTSLLSSTMHTNFLDASSTICASARGRARQLCRLHGAVPLAGLTSMSHAHTGQGVRPLLYKRLSSPLATKVVTTATSCPGYADRQYSLAPLAWQDVSEHCSTLPSGCTLPVL